MTAGRSFLAGVALIDNSSTRKQGRVTVPGKLGADLAPGTAASILRQAGLKR